MKLWIALIVMLLLIGCAADTSDTSAAKAPVRVEGSGEPQASAVSGDEYYLDHFENGDSVWLRHDNELSLVKIAGIKAPSLNEFGYQEACSELNRQLGDESKITVQASSVRPYASLFVDGKNIGLEMLRSGWVHLDSAHLEPDQSKAFMAAESEAKKSSFGLWSKN